jgi:hypothetical protein
MAKMNITEKEAKTHVRSGASKETSKVIDLTKEQVDKINNAIVKAVLDEAKRDADEWISFSKN